MIEFNISSDVVDIQRILDQIKESGITDVIINVTPPEKSRILSSAVPMMRLRHIARVVDAVTDDKKKGLSKEELIELLVADGLSGNTASVYISGASGAKVLERSEYGYSLTPLGRTLL